MKILLAVDGSKASDAAVDLLARMPFDRESTVTVLGVVEETTLAALEHFVVGGEAEHLDRWRDDARRQVETSVARACDALRGTPFPCEPRIRGGNVAEEILALAIESKADLIVLGTSTESHLVEFRLGGRRQKIVSHAPCSVMIARAKQGTSRAETNSPFKVLLAYDGSPMSMLAADQLQRLNLTNVDVTLLTVLTVATTLYGHDILERMRESWQAYKRECERALEDLATRFRSLARRVELKLIDGGAAPEDDIVRVAREVDADLVVVGSTGRGGFARLFLGSTASRVAQRSPCGVWVARGTPSPD